MGGQRVKTRDIVIFTRQFATMINAGLPLVQSLNILAAADREQDARRTSPGRWSTTSRAATRWPTRSPSTPRRSPSLYVNMVAAGEAGGILDTILLRLATFLEKNDALVRKVKGAMIYPGVIIIGGRHRHRGAAHLRHPDLPEHVRVGEPGAAAADPDRDRDVGLPDRLLVGHPRRHRRRRLRAQAATTPRRPAGRQIDALLLKAPVLGDVLRKSAVSRFTRTLGTLISLGRVDPRRPRDHGQDRGQPGDPRRGHGVAAVDRRRRDHRGAAREVEGLPADGHLDDRGRRADRRPGRDADARSPTSTTKRWTSR